MREIVDTLLGSGVEDVVETMKKYVENSSIADYVRVGEKYQNEYTDDIVQLYIGGTTSSTHMHVDMQVSLGMLTCACTQLLGSTHVHWVSSHTVVSS